MSSPLVTVLMPVYNGEAYLREAVQSIFGQSFGDFELLVVNDGSTDGSAEILRNLSDPRMRVVHNERNSGIIFTLNRGLELAQGVFVARMDADDMSRPERLARQVAFLDANPRVGLCGTWFRKFGAVEKTVRWETAPEAVRAGMLFSCSIAHPTVMLRREAFAVRDLRYDPQFPHAEDYDLWVRAQESMDIGNLPEVLLDYRVHPHQVTQRQAGAQVETAGRVRLRQLQAAGLDPSPHEFMLHQAISTCDISGVLDPFREGDHWLTKLLRWNRVHRLYAEPAFSRVLVEKWLTFANKCRRCPAADRSYLLRRPQVLKESGLRFFDLVRLLSRLRG